MTVKCIETTPNAVAGSMPLGHSIKRFQARSFALNKAIPSSLHFVTGGEKLDAEPGERVRIYFVNAGPDEFSSFHPTGEI